MSAQKYPFHSETKTNYQSCFKKRQNFDLKKSCQAKILTSPRNSGFKKSIVPARLPFRAGGIRKSKIVNQNMLRLFAKVISFLFHPLLILTYMLLLLLLVNPYLFGVNNMGGRIPLILIIFLSTFVIPAFAVLMMKFLGMVASMELETKQERIGPYIIAGVFYLWMFINFKENTMIPMAYTTFVLGATIALFVGFFVNIFSKISTHAIGMGGLIGMIVITMMQFSYESFTFNTALFGSLQLSMNLVLMIAIVIAGLVGTARLLLKAHEPKDLFGGYMVGFFTQFVALYFLF